MSAQTHKFTAETEKIFTLMVHALYENKEIFIRELISNASDACDKLRYQSQQNPDILGDQELKITVEVDKDARNLIISDNGIGMNKDSLIENLGTIAKSGTQSFLEKLTGDQIKDRELIGQFGVGFYSSFMVADNVNVISKAANENESWIWNSKGDGEYTISEGPKDIERGTSITLHIKEGEDEFLDKFRVKSIIEAYSNHIAFKIAFKEDNGAEAIINDGQAIWLRNKNEITEEEYNEYYKSISALGDDKPWATFHNRAEGLIEYKNLLYIPSKKPFDLFHPDRLTRIKLYIKRVLISEKLEVIPAYLRFLRGVIDSDDLPLNISRETVQNNTQLQKIRTAITKKILKELASKLKNEREDYLLFWENFGAVLKEGLCDGLEPRDELVEACLFQTNKGDELISLAEYKERMEEGQKSIYFINAEDKKNALASPQIEGFVKRGYEVIILTDSVDDFWVNVLHEYKDIPFKSVTKAGADLNDIDDNQEEGKEDRNQDKNSEDKKESAADKKLSKLTEYIKTVLGDEVSDVRKTTRLAESPVCLTVPEGAMDIRLERFMIENKQLAAATAKIFEINSDHKIIKKLVKDVNSKDFDSDESAKDGANETIALLYAQANIVEGEPVPDIKKFTSSLNKLIEKNMAA